MNVEMKMLVAAVEADAARIPSGRGYPPATQACMMFEIAMADLADDALPRERNDILIVSRAVIRTVLARSQKSS